jgi:hypothetical protein
MTQLQALLNQIDSKSMLLPEFQRGYVWNRDQVRGLLRSLYLDYPVGSLLVWETEAMPGEIRGEDEVSGNRTLLLDGQQRLTSLYGIVRGHAPEFFEGDANAFLGLRFNVEDETFEFYMPAKMKGDPRWVDVTKLFKEGLNPFIEQFNSEEYKPLFATYISRLSKLNHIQAREFHLEKIVGTDKTTDVVVDIFNRVNSGGTKLSKGDLALAKISAQSPELRSQMRKQLETWESNGFHFNLDWLLRNVNAVATGRALFVHLDDISMKDLRSALDKSTDYIDQVLNLISSRLGLDHDRVFMGRFALPVLALYLHQSGGKFLSKADQEKALYWYVHAGLWGRFAGSTESTLAQDYETLKKDGLDGLIQVLARGRGGSLEVSASDFKVNTMGSRFYPMLYLLTRVEQAQDLISGIALHKQLLGKLSSLQVHHIFPKKVLKDAGYERGEINAVANFCFLTRESNLYISKREPKDYFEEIVERLGHEDALLSQWIPLDRELWEVKNYRQFLEARRELLASASNEFLISLLAGQSQELALPKLTVAEEADFDDRELEINQLLKAFEEFGFVAPLRDIEIVHLETNELLAVAEAYWPDGLQPGMGQPIMLELNLDESNLDGLSQMGIKVFETGKALLQYAKHEAKVSAGVE